MKDCTKIQPARWVACTIIVTLLLLAVTSCGRVGTTARDATPSPTRPTLKANTKLQPFFDEQNNPVSVSVPAGQKVDMTPPPPPLNEFDRAVLRTCGPFGSRVKPDNFKQLLAKNPDVLRQIKQAVGGQLRQGGTSDSAFLDDLTAIWFKRGGFEHIFCGEISGKNKIGGLHFAGRYLQLQNEGIAGRLPNNSKREEVIPGVAYTLGVEIKQGDRSVRDNLKGYPYVSDAREILLEATKAFKAQQTTEGACIYTVRDTDTRKSYPAILVKNSSAIITFYSEITPKGNTCKN